MWFTFFDNLDRCSAWNLIPVCKETDRRWEQGEDPSMIDSDVYIYEKRTKLLIADPSERKKWSAIGLRRLMRESKLSQTPVSNALQGKPVRPQTLSIIRQTADRISPCVTVRTFPITRQQYKGAPFWS